MWKIKSIQYKNFRLLVDASLSLDNRGLCLVTGVNKDVPGSDSNMAAKSTLLHGLTWCLYGCDSLGNKLTKNVVHNSHDTCAVTVDFEDGNGNTCKVSRHRNNVSSPAVIVRMEHSYLNPLADIPESIQPYIDSVFGNKDLFLSSHIFGYDDTYVPFARRSDGDKRSLFDLLVDSEDLDRGLTKAGARIDEESKLLASNNRTYAYLRAWTSAKKVPAEKGEDIEGLTRVLASRKSNLIDLRTHSAKAKEELKKAVEEKDSITPDISKIEHEISNLQERKRIVDITADKLSAISRDISHYNSKDLCPVCGSEVEAKKKKDILDQLLNRKDKLMKKLRKLDSPFGFKGPLQIAETKKKELQTSLNELSSVVSTYRDTKNKCDWDIQQEVTRIKELEEELDRRKIAKHTDYVSAKALLDEVKSRIQERESLVEVLEFWKKGFGRTGIRSHRINNSILPELNAIAEELSSIMFGDGSIVKYTTQRPKKDGGTTDFFDQYVEDSKGNRKEVLSAGESLRRDLIHLFCTVELSEELDKRTVDFMAFDEAFRTLDRTGVARTMEILENLSETIGTILVVEHNDAMQSQFGSHITVTRKDDHSLIL
jgi:DNA repair exonuclease SbcCD ATPase subunit